MPKKGWSGTTYLVAEDGTITREGWKGESYFDFYGGLRSAVKSKDSFLEWITDENDRGEAGEVLCEALHVKSLGKALSSLDNLSSEEYEEKLRPVLMAAFKESPDWSDDRYWDVECGDTYPELEASDRFGKMDPELLEELSIEFEDWGMEKAILGIDVDDANKILRARRKHFRFRKDF